MPRQKSTDKLDALREQQRQLEARIKAETAKLSEQARKDDTRRKVVVGGVILNHLDKFPQDAFSKKTRELLTEYVQENARHLFDFLKGTPGPKAEKNGTTPSASPAADAAE